jgi:hypothetical protein
MTPDEPMEAFEGKITLAKFMADKADRLEAEYTRVEKDEGRYSRWFVTCLSGYRPQELDHEPQPYDL